MLGSAKQKVDAIVSSLDKSGCDAMAQVSSRWVKVRVYWHLATAGAAKEDVESCRAELRTNGARLRNAAGRSGMN